MNPFVFTIVLAIIVGVTFAVLVARDHRVRSRAARRRRLAEAGTFNKAYTEALTPMGRPPREWGTL